MNFMTGRGFYQESSSSSPHSVPTVVPTKNEDSEEQILQLGGGASTATPAAAFEKEHMFDKVVTPSDVGKLNRLVIPKQHAEKYFPLDSSLNEKGLLLNFEDRNGKPWRFRYSYWNSSQSYVMTKGWSRFVKEKKLDAGDIVSFQRGVGEIGRDRLFIDWRRRPDAPDLVNSPLPMLSTFQAHQIANYNRSTWNPLFLQPPSREYSHFHHHPYAYNNIHNNNHAYHHHTVVNGNPCPPGSIFYLKSGTGIIRSECTGQNPQMVYESVPVVQGKAAAKRLRLFGVNMDCPISSDQTVVDDENVSVMLNPAMPMTLQQYFPAAPSPGSSSSSIVNGLSLRPDYHREDDKGKGSMSLDLDM